MLYTNLAILDSQRERKQLCWGYILYIGIMIAVNIGFILQAVQPVVNGTMFRNWVERNIDKSYNVLLGLGIRLFSACFKCHTADCEKIKKKLKRQNEKENVSSRQIRMMK